MPVLLQRFYELYAIAATVLGAVLLAGAAESGQSAGHPELAGLRRHGHGVLLGGLADQQLQRRRQARVAARGRVAGKERAEAGLDATGGSGTWCRSRLLVAATRRS